MSISWTYWHDNPSNHLLLTPLSPPEPIEGPPRLSITANYKFEISISKLAADIGASVLQVGGYLDSLKQDAELQGKFDAAILQIYDPTNGRPGSP
jgi:hypothetical protein